MQNKFVQFLKEWIVPVLVAVVAVSLIRVFVFEFVKVNGPSMTPNLQNNELVLLSKVSKYKRGDVVVFDARQEDPRIRSGEKDYVKRIIGLPVSYTHLTLPTN